MSSEQVCVVDVLHGVWKSPSSKVGVATVVVNTNGKMFTDMTEQLEEAVCRMTAHEGILTVCSLHTTACVDILENETLSLNDIMDHLDKVAPMDEKYSHDRIELRDVPPDERINGVAHIRALYFPHSIQIPIMDGELVLGKWQTPFLVDLDGPRDRTVRLTFVGI